MPAAGRRVRRFTASFTTRGRCLIAGGVAAVLCGFGFGEVDLLRAGIFAIAIVLLALVVVERSQVSIEGRRTAAPTRATVGTPVAIALTLTNRSFLPTGALMLEDQLPEQLTGRARFRISGLRPHESRTAGYRVPVMARGAYRAGPLRMRLTDPFGLVDATHSFTATSTFLVIPVVEPLAALALPQSLDVGENAGSHSIGTHGADDASTREYRNGDDLRKVHWRSSARTGVLMVRHEERPSRGHTTLLLDTRIWAHNQPDPAVLTAGQVDAREVSSLEWAISATASIGSHLMQAGREVGLVSQTTSGQRHSFGSTAAFVDHLAQARPSPQPALGSILPAVRVAARESTVVAVLGRVDEFSLTNLAKCRPRGSSITTFAIVLDPQSWDAADRPGLVPDAAADQEKVVQTLRAAGWWVVTVPAGQSIPEVWSRLLSRRGFDSAARAQVARAAR